MKRIYLPAGSLCLVLAASLLHLGCRKGPPPEAPPEPAWFVDATRETKLHFVHDAGPVDEQLYFMPQIVGSGAAFFDFDGDGLLDVYLLHNGGPKGKKNQLFKQMPGGTFKDVSAGSGLDVADFGMGVAVGDVNNDGLPDVLVTGYQQLRLFLNQGGGKFVDVTREAGLDEKNSYQWGVSAAFVDYDRDGWLDLVVVNSVAYDPTWQCQSANGTRDYCSPKPFKGTVSKLFRNLGKTAGKAGTPRAAFRDVSFESGIGRVPGPGLGVVCADFDGDGWPDILVANDGAPNHLWMNQLGKRGRKAGEPFFKEEAVARGLAVNAMGQPEANMGIGWADVDGDGLQDVFVTHLSNETNTVWVQGPRGVFSDRTVASGMAHPKWRATGFGTMLADFNCDGWPDAVIANGRVSRQPPVAGSELGPFFSQYGERNQLFVNNGDGTFRDVSPSNAALCGYDNIGRGLAIADLRNDGNLWVLVTGVAGPARLFRCVAPDRGHWLVVRAFDPKRKRDALGAELTVHAGGRKFVRTVHAAGSYLCSNDPRAHVGLGKVDSFDSIEVVWPDADGRKEVFPGGRADRHLVLERGKGKRAGD